MGVHFELVVQFSADLTLWLESPVTTKHVHLLPTVFFQFHLEES